ncbi:hypothetical protein HK096_000244, partial [Nowakowskiella sp. JEL0078]
MALEELSAPSAHTDDPDDADDPAARRNLITKLFELAIAQYETQLSKAIPVLPSPTSIPATTKRVGRILPPWLTPSITMSTSINESEASARLALARCLREFNRFMGTPEIIDRAINEAQRAIGGAGRLGVLARLEVVRGLMARLGDVFRGIDEDEDEEIGVGLIEREQEDLKEVRRLALEMLSKDKDVTIILEIAVLLHDYGVMQKQLKNCTESVSERTEQIISTFSLAATLFESLSLESHTASSLCIWGITLFSQAEQYASYDFDNENEIESLSSNMKLANKLATESKLKFEKSIEKCGSEDR